MTPRAGTKCQETKSISMPELNQVLNSLFPEGIIGLQKQGGEENVQRIKGKRKARDSAGTPPQHCGRKRVHSDTEGWEKLRRSRPVCPPPKRRCACRAATQRGSHHQLAYGSGQRVLPPVPGHPEFAGSCQANEKQAHRKRKHSCAEGCEGVPKSKR